MSNYNQLILKLDQFIRKFYLNQVLRGSLYTIAVLGSVFLLFSLSEHYFYFGTGVRTFFLFSFIGLALAAAGFWIVYPLLKYFKLGDQISRNQAAEIVGDHFGSVKDKLLNVLQLHDQMDVQSGVDNSLLLAGIEQKTEEIKLVPFKQAIDLSGNKKYLKYAVPPALVILALLIGAPSMITDSTDRILKNSQEFERPAPFSFIVDQNNLEAVQYEDVQLSVRTEGDVIPVDAFVEIDGYKYRMQSDEKTVFNYNIKNLTEDKTFYVTSGSVRSMPYTIKVLKLPSVTDFKLKVDYPGYTGRRDEILDNSGNAIVPVGTRMEWVFKADHTTSIDMRYAHGVELIPFTKTGSDFIIKKRIMKDSPYAIYLSNQHVALADSLKYAIRVIPDQFPSIQVEHFPDTIEGTMQYFAGDARDDYGLSKLLFHTIVYNKSNQEKSRDQVMLKKPGAPSINFTHEFDVNKMELDGGDRLEFYFEIFDNDAVQGAKSTKTRVMSYRKPALEELLAEQEQNSEEIKEELSSSMEELKKLQEEMQKLREKLLQEKNVNWQAKQKMQAMMEKRQELMNQIQKAQENFQENLQKQEQMEPPSENIQEKQEKLEQLYEEMLSEEDQQKMDELQELMEKLEKDQALEELEKMEMSNDELEMELDRMLELYKNLEVEHELEKMADALEKLAEEQEKLSEETKKKEDGQDTSEQQEKQEEIEEKLDKLQEKMEEIQEKNDKLEKPKEIGDPQEDMESVEKDMENSQEQMGEKQNKKASKSQKNAAEKMKQMSQQMQQQMQSGEMQQMEEDMETLRQLLENLVELSFDQEDLITYFSRSKINTPYYVELVQDQFKIKDDFRVVEDTLVALARRNDKIETYVMDKVLDIKSEFKKSLKELEDRKKTKAANYQQRGMKNINDLALMLSETMEQMQQQMANAIPGSQSCEKPGGAGQSKSGKPSDKMSGQQKGMGEEMKKLGDKMKNGYEGSAEEFGKLAQRQAAIREALKKMSEQNREQGKGDGGLEQLIEDMNKIETDLVNKKLTSEMMKRQEDILTRLLKSEQAERQREQDNKRQSRTAQEQPREIPPAMQEYLRQREGQIEDFNKISPALRPFYKQLVEEYVRRARAK